MAFPYIGGQIPQPNNPVETAARSFSMTQKAIADNLALQQQKQFNKAYPQLLQQQIDLAGAQLAQQETAAQYAPQTAEANLAKLLAQVEGKQIANRYAAPAAEADIAYKQGIGLSSLQNAQIAALNAQLAEARLPVELDEIRKRSAMLEMEHNLLAQMLGAQSPQGISGNATGLQSPNAQQITTPDVAAVKTSPADYLPPLQPEQFDYAAKVMEKYKSTPQLEEEKARAGARATQQERNYASYTKRLGEAAEGAVKDNELLDMMVAQYGEIPEWNKGLVLGNLKALSGDSKVYEALHSGGVLTALGNLTGTASEGDRLAIEREYPDRTYPEKDMQKVAVLRQIRNDRVVEKQKFAAEHPEYTEPQLESAWNTWLNDNSIYDDERYQSYIARRRSKMSPLDAEADEIKELERQLQGSK